MIHTLLPFHYYAFLPPPCRCYACCSCFAIDMPCHYCLIITLLFMLLRHIISFHYCHAHHYLFMLARYVLLIRWFAASAIYAVCCCQFMFDTPYASKSHVFSPLCRALDIRYTMFYVMASMPVGQPRRPLILHRLFTAITRAWHAPYEELIRRCLNR